MKKPLSVLLQYILPHHLLSSFAGYLAESKQVWLKRAMIHSFIRYFKVNMSEAIIEDPDEYTSFNEFFTRLLKPGMRPITQGPQDIACPADGRISQIGKIQADSLFQAKGFYYTVSSLLGGSAAHAALFKDGRFATIYLSPRDYHRVHMPVAGTLRETIYIPGRLFSVNVATVDAVPNLFSRNERLVCLFDTAIGPMAVILVGALLVGSMRTAWNTPITKDISTQKITQTIELSRGEELGYFQMGSTVLVLFGNQSQWDLSLREGSAVRMGQLIGTNEKG